MVIKDSAIFLTALMVILTLCVSAEGAVVVEPANDFVTPTQFGFDLIINNPDGVSAQGFQTTVVITGPVVTLDVPTSEAVEDDLDYWIYGNSTGPGAIVLAIDAFQFGDGPNDGNAEALLVGDIVSRYVFNRDVAGLYEIHIDLDESSSYVVDEDFNIQGLSFTPGSYEGGTHNFYLFVPEPATLMLLTLGGTIPLKKRKA